MSAKVIRFPGPATVEEVLSNMDEVLIKYPPKALYVMAFDDKGGSCIWISGDMKDLPVVSLAFQDLAFKQLNGMILEE